MTISTDKEFNRYSIAVFDFEAALRFARAAEQHVANSVEYEALLFAAIVSYARPFSGNERSKRAAATSRLANDFVATKGDDRKLHARCLQLRNQALAHSEHARNPTRLRASGVAVSRRFSLLTPSFDLTRFIRIADECRHACELARAEYVLGKRRVRR